MPEQSYPTMRYHPTEATPVMVSTPDELKALGTEWIDHPYTPEEVAAWQAEQSSGKDADETPPARSSRR